MKKLNSKVFCFTLLSTSLVFTSCDEAARKKISAEMNKTERTAISAVMLQMQEPAKLIGATGGLEGAAALQNFMTALKAIQRIDVSSCPKDFRDSWHQFKNAALEYQLGFEGIPKTDTEKFLYGFQKGTEGKLDGGMNELKESLTRKNANFTTTFSEVVAVAKQYGVE